MIQISVMNGPRELRAAVLAMKAAKKDMRKQINDSMRGTFNPVWRQLLAQNMGGFSPADDMVLKGARIAAGNPPRLVAAASRRRYGRALIPVRDWHLVEYGMRDHPTTYRRSSRKGGTHEVTRVIGTGWPARTTKGRILGPATRQILPRITAYWIQSVKKAYITAIEKG